ncbi:phytosulfokines-like [Prosopis cineraria]|uniref:phytosulfokines-like n=1 Tax=Prosopis cineraria TaxID=364024 RepID=UPI00240EDEFB|nr:phytosulfokines-like [Prosopis cineraria]
MAKLVSIMIICLILLSVAEGRVISPDSDSHRSVHHSPSHLAASPSRLNDDDDDQYCKGIGREDCLFRKTMAAHADYIYTQDKNGP